MEFLKNILAGQKIFILDLFAIINFVLLSFAYFLGVGLSFFSLVFFKENKGVENKNSYWKISNLTEKEISSFLSQF